MKLANLAFFSAIILVANIPSTEAKKKNKNKKGNGKNKGLRSPAATPSKSNKKPDGDVSDLFKSNKKKPSSRNINNRKPSNKKSPNKKPSQSNKKPSGSKPSNRAVDDDVNFDGDIVTPIPTYIPTVSGSINQIALSLSLLSSLTSIPYHFVTMFQYIPTVSIQHIIFI